jgi:hypothetical protein
LRWSLENFLPRLASNLEPPHLSLLSSLDYRREPMCLNENYILLDEHVATLDKTEALTGRKDWWDEQLATSSLTPAQRQIVQGGPSIPTELGSPCDP